MKYYLVSEDWITHLETDFRAEILATLKNLSLQRLQKYPPPKIYGLPVGNESRILRRYIKGESSQLDPSALSTLYRKFAKPRERLLYLAFRQNEKLSRADWAEIIGAENIEKWIANKCFRETENGKLVCRFSIIGIDNLIYAVDPLNDHGNPAETVALAERNSDAADENVQPFHHTYIGLDSLRLIEIMRQEKVSGGARYLDCGQGAGAILLYFSRFFDESVGIDVNPRAVRLARFNAELNDLKNCRVYEDDALNLKNRFGRFDLISWNLPFVFLPDEKKDESVDAFGGDYGIELGLNFIETLPDILAENGTVFLEMLAPIRRNGTNVLEENLKPKLARLKLDCTVIVSQITLSDTRELWDFHKSRGIEKFESVYLKLNVGRGFLKRIETPTSRKILDAVREKLYRRKFA